jgi:hypothetical protein
MRRARRRLRLEVRAMLMASSSGRARDSLRATVLRTDAICVLIGKSMGGFE